MRDPSIWAILGSPFSRPAVAAVVRVAGENGEGAVKLLREDDACQFMGQGHEAEREQQAGLLASDGGPSVRGADCENGELTAIRLLIAEATGQGLRGNLNAARIQQNEPRGGAGTMFGKRVEKGLLGAVDLGFRGNVDRKAAGVLLKELLNRAGAGERSNRYQEKFHAFCDCGPSQD